MSLNLNDRPPSGGSTYCTSQAFTDAVNDSRLVRTFGTVSLIGSILLCIGGAVAIGVGLAVIGFGSTRYYRLLGLTVLLLGLVGFLFAPGGLIGSMVLSAGVAWGGLKVLGTLSTEGKDDPDWQSTRSRAITGITLSTIGFVVTCIWLAIFIVGFIAKH